MSLDPTSCDDLDANLLAHFQSLWAEAEQIWDRQQNDRGFSGYVSADYPAVLKSLRELRSRCHTFLEWGSGLGVVTIMASRLGYDAYGIEVAPELVDHARSLAERYAPEAVFATGSFIPDEYVVSPRRDYVDRTETDDPGGYEELDMELSDFDLVYAYPWPTEHHLFQNIVRECGRPGTLLLTYDAHEGIDLTQF